MKKVSIICLILFFITSMVFIGSGCKVEEAAPVEEEGVEEAVEEEAPAEEEVEEVKEAVTLEWWIYGASPEYLDWANKWTDLWNKEHPDVQINTTTQVWDTIFEHFQTAASTDTMPDIVSIHQPFINAFGVKGGYFVPFDDFPNFEETKDSFVEGYMKTCKSGGKYWGVPSTSFSFGLAGNKALFDEAGLELPKTWDEFRETAKALTKDTDNDGVIDQYGTGIMGADLAGVAYRLVEFVYKAGGAVLNEDWTGTEFNEAPWIETLKLYQNLMADGSIDPAFLADDFTTISDKFANGIIAMSVEGFYWESVMDSKELGIETIYGIIPEPENVLGPHTPGTLGDGTVIAITSTCADVQGAWEYIQYMSSPELDLDALKMDALNGLPLTKEVSESEEFQTIPGWKTWAEEGETVKGWTYHPSISEIQRDVIAPLALQVINGDLTAEEAMQKADELTIEILNR